MGKTKKVLIVEDEVILAFTLKRIIEKAGYEVVGSTAYGEEAVRAAEDGRPDIILMDIFLKGEMNGIAAATRINQNIPTQIIYLTGNTDEATYEQAMHTKHAAYMKKPVDKSDLLKAMQMALQGA